MISGLMSMNNLEKENLIIEIERFLSEITIINDQLSVYLDIYACIEDPDCLLKLNQAPAFFTITILALRSNIIMGVARLFDADPEAKTIKKLIARSKSNKKFFMHELKTGFIYEDDQEKCEVNIIKVDIDKMLNELDKELGCILASPSIESIKVSRDKIIAHNDKKYFLDKESVPKIPVEDIKRLTEFAEKACNALLKHLNGEVIATKSSNVNDLNRLIGTAKTAEGVN